MQAAGGPEVGTERGTDHEQARIARKDDRQDSPSLLQLRLGQLLYPGEKFPSLIEELVEVASPAGQVGQEELVQFFLRTQRMESAQDRAEKLQQEFAITRKG